MHVSKICMSILHACITYVMTLGSWHQLISCTLLGDQVFTEWVLKICFFMNSSFNCQFFDKREEIFMHNICINCTHSKATLNIVAIASWARDTLSLVWPDPTCLGRKRETSLPAKGFKIRNLKCTHVRHRTLSVAG